MTLIDGLQDSSSDVDTLQNYLTNNFQEVYDFFNHSKHSVLLESRDKINRYIRLNQQIVLQLDISKKTDLAFISLLLEVSERLGLIASFRYLFEHLQNNHYNIGRRLKAASQYLIGVTTADDYLDRYDDIYSQLQESYETEEDNADKVLMTIVHYYGDVVNNFGHFNPKVPNVLKEKILKSKANKSSFLNDSIIDRVLQIDLSLFDSAYHKIHLALDSFLGRELLTPTLEKKFIIEDSTRYTTLLKGASVNFDSIRNISVKEYSGKNSVFNSLQRGVKVLTDEDQLYAYMRSYGNMHYSKLASAFAFLPDDFFERNISIIDWGCGQALGSMTYLDFLKTNDIQQKIEVATLIEPSKIALKRGALHITKFNSSVEIKTINKYLDSLVVDDFNDIKTNTKLHIFSNILDIELFSLSHLLNLISLGFEGENYFLCVSPYIYDTRTSRLDTFVKYFSGTEDFDVLGSIDNQNGEWMNGWTRVVRVFKVTL